MITNWNAAYDNMGMIENSNAYPTYWSARASKFRKDSGLFHTDLPYGDGPRHQFDLALPAEAKPKGLIIFVHGGFWMRTDKSLWSHLAAGPLTQGWAVGLPSYTLAPDARIGQITREIAAAITELAPHVDGPIRLIGHSAGGHLVTRMMCADIALPCADRIDHVLSLSGLHDLRPLMRTDMNQTLRLDADEAASESPALLTPRAGPRLTTWVGGAELPEFLRQSDLLANIWSGLGVETTARQDPGKHHFSILRSLEDPNGSLTRVLTAS